MNPFKVAKGFNGAPKWQNFAKSGHTDGCDIKYGNLKFVI